MVNELSRAPASARTALVVEDDTELRAVLVQFLEDLGYRTEVAHDGCSAMAIFAARPEIGIVVADVVMPGEISGADLGKWARSQRPAVKVVLISGYPETEFEVRGVSIEGLPLLRKPFRLSDLERLLDHPSGDPGRD